MEKSLSCLGLLAVTRLPSCQVGALARPSPAVRFPRNRHRMGDVSMVEWPHLENTPETYPREVLPLWHDPPSYSIAIASSTRPAPAVTARWCTLSTRISSAMWLSSASSFPKTSWAAARLEALEARMAADLEEVEAGASGAETGGRWSECGPGCSLGRRCRHGCHRGDPAGSSSAAAFPADPDFLGGPRRAPSAPVRDRGVPCAAEGVPPWEDWDDFGDPDDDSVDVAGADDFDAEAAEDEWGTPSFPGTPPRPTSPVGGAGRRASRVG